MENQTNSLSSASESSADTAASSAPAASVVTLSSPSPSANVDINQLMELVRSCQMQLSQHAQTLENFRTSFKNFDQQLSQLKERNRLR